MLAAGRQLGPYEILDPLGAGAMGEVYRALDRRLEREVAVKILPEPFITDPERLGRFEQEARAAGRLNHPNILAIHDVGTHDGTPYVVSELLDGQTLRERLDAGPIPVRRMLEFALQIAEGLAAAHDHGIVHRDLKPENLFVTREGRLKILDFGLAKLTRPGSPAGAAGGAPSVAGLTGSQTIMGTAGYMAPEQVLGQPADPRSDIFAFGTILYEMLSGERAFRGGSSVEIMAAILNAEPAPLPDERADVPSGLNRIIERCLEKDPVRRFQSAHDLAFVLGSVHEAPGGLREDLTIRGGASRRRARVSLPAIAAGLVLGAVLGAAVARLLPAPAGSAPGRFQLAVPEAALVNRNPGDVAVSPDGRAVAFVASDSSSSQYLWVRTVDSEGARKLAGTEAAYLPFWSPDGRSIAFFANGKLLRIPAAGGPVVDICPAPSGRGGSWGRGDVIVFAPASSGPLHRVRATGGESVAVTRVDSTRHETGHRFPCFLPDGRHFLFVAIPARQGNYDAFVGSLASGEARPLMTSAAAPVYAEPGWLVFARNGQMMAQRFDPRGRRLRGEPAVLGEASGFSTYDSEPATSVSATGAMAFPSASLQNTELVWFDLQGERRGTVRMPVGHYEALRISPDGRRVAVERRNSATSSDIWIADLTRDVATRLVFEPGRNLAPAWSPGSDRIAYSSNRTGPQVLYVRRLDGSGSDETLPTVAPLFNAPQEWTGDGRALIVLSFDLATSWDLWALPLEGERVPKPLVRGLANEGPASLSPDGRWLAYASDRSGISQYYVQSYPEMGEPYQLSEEGTFNGATVPSPVWLAGGRRFAYLGPDGVSLMISEVGAGPGFSAQRPRPLFRLPPGALGLAVTPDGGRLLATLPVGSPRSAVLNYVVDWNRLPSP